MGRPTSLSIVFAAFLAATACLPSKAHAQTPVWAEEFDGPGIETDNWVFDWGTGAHLGLWGWGNGELQYYTDRPENARIEDGVLIIEARREDYEGSPFTSARLKTENRMAFKYGTLEARIRLPDMANGLWPAYWLLGATGVWPMRGEIDIMEAGNLEAINDGVVNRWIGGAVHWAGPNGEHWMHHDSRVHDTNLNENFHIYKLTWDDQFIRTFIDDIEYFAIDISPIEAASLHELHKPHFLLLNLAVGGQYTGIMDAGGVTAPLPGRMEIDYVRLYQDHPDSELHLGEYAVGPVPPPRFGVFTERSDLAGALDYADDTNLFIWHNLTDISAGVEPYEGESVWAFRANAGEWFGMGVHTAPKDMSNYAGGSLKFHMRTTSAAPFRIGVKPPGPSEFWLPFNAGGEQYGLVRDGEWHEVTIPLSAFAGLDLSSVEQMFMLVADPYGENVDIFIDNVYYLAPESDIFEDGFEATEADRD